MEVLRKQFLAEKNYKNGEYLAIFISIIAFAYYFIPLLFNGENSHVVIHDGLDSDFTYSFLLAKTHNLFACNPLYPVNNIMNGIPRACLPSGINIYNWIIYLFPNFYGYIINLIIIRAIGFYGMYFFIRNWLLKEPHHKALIILVSLSFSLLPIYAFTGIATLGIPLLANAFLFIHKGSVKIKYFLIPILYSLYCYNNMEPIIIGFTALFVIYSIVQSQKLNYKLLLAFLLLLFTFIISEYQLLYVYVFNKFSLSRSTFHYITTLNYKGVLGVAFLTIIEGFYHSANYPLIVPVTAAIYLGIGVYYKENLSKLFIIIGLLIFVGLCYSLCDWKALQFLYTKVNFFDEFSFKRVHYFLPSLIYLLLAGSVALADKRIPIAKFILFPVILCFTFYANRQFNSTNQPYTFRQYYSTDLYSKIGNYIGKNKKDYRICNVGIAPSIAQYNGFYTLDSYQNVYPAKYKNEFKEIIAPELNKDSHLQEAFDSTIFSNRCYTYSAEVFERKNTDNTIQNLALNYQALKNLNCRYIFSNQQIKSFSTDSIVFDKKFSGSNSPYTIYLYKIL